MTRSTRWNILVPCALFAVLFVPVGKAASATRTPTPMPTATATSTPITHADVCPGDCNDDGFVTVDEMVRGVNIALGGDLGRCAAFDTSNDQVVTVDEMVQAVTAALEGCGVERSVWLFERQSDTRGCVDGAVEVEILFHGSDMTVSPDPVVNSCRAPATCPGGTCTSEVVRTGNGRIARADFRLTEELTALAQYTCPTRRCAIERVQEFQIAYEGAVDAARSFASGRYTLTLPLCMQTQGLEQGCRDSYCNNVLSSGSLPCTGSFTATRID